MNVIFPVRSAESSVIFSSDDDETRFLDSLRPDDKKCVAHDVRNLPDGKICMAHDVGNLPDGKICMAHAVGNLPDEKLCIAVNDGKCPGGFLHLRARVIPEGAKQSGEW
jgi:hypothetical protein